MSARYIGGVIAAGLIAVEESDDLPGVFFECAFEDLADERDVTAGYWPKFQPEADAADHEFIGSGLDDDTITLVVFLLVSDLYLIVAHIERVGIFIAFF